MKINFSFFFRINFYCSFCVIAMVIFLSACNKKQPKPVFDLNTPGSQVVASYNDSTPQVVYYYKVDEKGETTQEKIGEAYYYENKQEYIGGGLKEGKREGKWYAFFKDGSVQTEAFYVDGKMDGSYKVYQENGKLLYKGHYDHGNCDGTWYFYDSEGKVTKVTKADKNTIVCGYCPRCLELKQNMQKAEEPH